MPKIYLDQNVYEAAKERTSWAFDNFEKIIISFSGGKDSTAMTHIVMEEAIKRSRKVCLFFVDWECQFKMTIEHIQSIYDQYSEHIEPYWICLPLLTDNACSMYEPVWKCWNPDKKKLWVRDMPKNCIKDPKFFDFYFKDITFEEFAPMFAKWYANGDSCANFIGIRTQESLNRFRAVSMRKKLMDGKKYTTNIVDNCWSVYPIYDWSTEDIWIYNGVTGNIYNQLYDRMAQAGLSIHQMRIDEPFGDTSRRGLWLYQIIEPETWAKLVCRVQGANTVNEYGRRKGNVLGNHSVSLPNGHTWQTFAKHLLSTMPPKTAEHYSNKIAKYLQWYKERGYPNGIEDDAHNDIFDKVPSWKRVVKCLLKNDYWCRTLGFSITKSSNYENYMKLMRKKRKEWAIL